MEYHEWLKQIKAGDDVVVKSFNFGERYYNISKVEKVTPTGFIRVGGILYKPKDGWSRSGRSKLLDPNDEETISDVKKYEEKDFVRRTVSKIRDTNYNDVTYEQAVEISKIMGWL